MSYYNIAMYSTATLLNNDHAQIHKTRCEDNNDMAQSLQWWYEMFKAFTNYN